MSFTIETERLILRDLQEEDLTFIIELDTNPDVQSNLLSFQSDEMYIKQNFENSILHAKQHPRFYYALAIILKRDNRMIGTCGLFNVIPDSTETSIGWNISSQYQGNGFATEAAKKLLNIGFESNDVSRIFADCADDNIASIRVMEKIGMKQHHNCFLFRWIRGRKYGERKSIVRYHLWKNQWLAQRGYKILSAEDYLEK